MGFIFKKIEVFSTIMMSDTQPTCSKLKEEFERMHAIARVWNIVNSIITHVSRSLAAFRILPLDLGCRTVLNLTSKFGTSVLNDCILLP